MVKRPASAAKLAVLGLTLLVVLGSIGGTAAAQTTQDESLPSHFDSSTVDGSTAVVVVADLSTSSGQQVYLNGLAYAREHNLGTPIVVPPASDNSSVPADLTETLSPKIENQGLRKAVVIGEDTSAYEYALTDVSAVVDGKRVFLRVSAIDGSNPADIAFNLAQGWEATDSMIVSSGLTSDLKKSAVTLSNDTIAGAPVMYHGSSFEAINQSASDLGVTTVYVTPGVSDSLRDKLDNHYTVRSSVLGVSLDQSLDKVAVGLAREKTEDTVITNGNSNHVFLGASAGVGNNSTLLVTKDNTTLGSPTRDKLANLTEVDNVYVVGNDEDVSDEVYSSISNTVRANASVDRISYSHNVRVLSHRMSLLTSGYVYPMHVTFTTSLDDGVEVEIVNIGFATQQTYDGQSVVAYWTDDTITQSTPNGTYYDYTSQYDGEEYVVAFNKTIDPGKSRTVTVKASSLSRGGHPELEYNVERFGGAYSVQSGYIGWFENFLDNPLWIVDKIQEFLPSIEIPFKVGWKVWGIIGLGILGAGAGVAYIAFRLRD